MAFLADKAYQIGAKKLSRKTNGGFNLVSCYPVNGRFPADFCNLLKKKNLAGPMDIYVCYELPVTGDPKLIMVYVLHCLLEILLLLNIKIYYCSIQDLGQ